MASKEEVKIERLKKTVKTLIFWIRASVNSPLTQHDFEKLLDMLDEV